MDRYTFRRLVNMLQTTGRLRATRNLTVDEQVAIFLYILAHHQKNRTMKTNFLRSGETISRYFNKVLSAVLRLQGHLLKAPMPIAEDSTDVKWKWFKNCIGALDGTHIEVKVSENHIRDHMPVDPIETHYNDNLQNEDQDAIELDGEPITSVEPTQEWTDWRYNLASQMFNQWMQNRHVA
ncbi:uncharacterized protein LOC130990693 [Salvia miltiorrhiza]|uniref:uncharacterized protein LOC130990693 n=1 Tax=Salvia miltiorrhiza TaxID=226208 RepID=UPI0025AC2F16|nr:uncharacterized protein LOC130990693 [Salvia miltiorrhiza]